MNNALVTVASQSQPMSRQWSESSSQSHATLFETLAELKEIVGRHQACQRKAVVEQLAHLRNVLAGHFAFEQQPDYLASVLEHHPELEHKAHELLSEHRRLSEQLDRLIEEGRAINSSMPELQKDTLEWLALVRFHESRENRLLQDAVGLDIAAED